ncbi:Nucleoid-associated protein YgaU, contains BON and LysM domains [Nocardioides alpinus]|uniref:LysM peptidoglycan-binding domain-containing protein n=1 Tax=Nocardioides alpinus TaxID=748909 RepID=A0A1I1AKR8_9ACTN|nr:LysM peptidoglycan-binding domain-containing protein [Nocardioides alpinus]PKH41727.1 LysM peptidoglycan-binding domain-containing protein [Nocardioides alpinus]SFB38625.1 Nucleoid-associated protein YgaU, contains BON and LysM domains [Nocardioides alpinus]
MTPPTLRQRLHGLAATLVILLLVIGMPLMLIGIGAHPWDTEFSELGLLLSARDDGTLALTVIAVAAWTAWIVVAVSVVVEGVARLRGLPAPSLPGLGLPQHGASQLVAVAALLFIATPTVSLAVSPAPVHAASAAPVPHTPHTPQLESADTAPVLVESAPAATGVSAAPVPSFIDYTVKRGDSLWRIAERMLGEGGRYTEIVELNREVLHGRPDFIVAGTVLKVPQEADSSSTNHPVEEYEVQPGDTLSEIAETQLGDPLRYPDLFEASSDTIQHNGAHLTDPDLIQPGWTITIPNTTHRGGKTGAPQDRVPLVVVPPELQPTPEADPTRAAVPEPEPTPSAEATAPAADETATPGWLLPGLTGAGALLAGLVLLAVRAHRNTQLRYRRPGQTIAPPPPELRAVEKTAMHAGAPMTGTIKQLDQALRALAADTAAAGRAVPRLVRAVLADDTVTLHLAEDSELPAPWAGAGQVWSTQLRSDGPVTDVLAPYPLLVSTGQDEAGGLHLLNLEAFGVADLSGDIDAATALARHMAAELALNPWSVLVNVNVIGFGQELAELDTLRLHHHDNGDKVIASIAETLATAQESDSNEPDPFWAVITTGDGASELAMLLTASATARLGAALVTVNVPVPGSLLLEIDSRGRLLAPAFGLDLQAAGLTALEASACAAIVDLTRESEAIRIPTTTSVPGGWRAMTDHAGAIRSDLAKAREVQGTSEGSLLPRPVEEYLDAAATTAKDVVTLAPVVPAQVRRQVEQSDPTLDQDVADWFDTESVRPRLILLGPVTARAYGIVAPAITKRRPYFVELLAFLALHPEGVTGSAVADAFSIAGSRARTDLGSLRAWLGESHRTGHEHLPPANGSPTFRRTGVKAYQVQDVLVDLDLFRRLRARGEARGSEGISDLKTALSLVEGLPFSHLRERGWSWLLDGERLHETIGCAIVDTAHVIVVDALANDDLTTARRSAETACKAAPYDDICRLDLVKVTAAEGHGEAADRMLDDDIFNRTDDHLPPIDLPVRTVDVVGNAGWNTRRPSQQT